MSCAYGLVQRADALAAQIERASGTDRPRAPSASPRRRSTARDSRMRSRRSAVASSPFITTSKSPRSSDGTRFDHVYWTIRALTPRRRAMRVHDVDLEADQLDGILRDPRRRYGSPPWMSAPHVISPRCLIAASVWPCRIGARRRSAIASATRASIAQRRAHASRRAALPCSAWIWDACSTSAFATSGRSTTSTGRSRRPRSTRDKEEAVVQAFIDMAGIERLAGALFEVQREKTDGPDAQEDLLDVRRRREAPRRRRARGSPSTTTSTTTRLRREPGADLVPPALPRARPRHLAGDRERVHHVGRADPRRRAAALARRLRRRRDEPSARCT